MTDSKFWTTTFWSQKFYSKEWECNMWVKVYERRRQKVKLALCAAEVTRGTRNGYMVRQAQPALVLWKEPSLNWKPLGEWGVGHCQSGSFKKVINLLPPPVFEPLFLRLQPVPQSLYPLRYSVIVGFRRGCTEFFRLLCYYDACRFETVVAGPPIGSIYKDQTVRPLKIYQ